MALQNLSKVASVSPGDLVALFSGEVGSDATATLQTIAQWLQKQLTTNSALVTQYAAPNATGFNVTVQPPTTGASVFLILSPLVAYASGTVTLPAQSTCVDGQEVVVHCTQSVAALSISGNGATVNGAPTAITANGYFKLRYDGVFRAWYRIG